MLSISMCCERVTSLATVRNSQYEKLVSNRISIGDGNSKYLKKFTVISTFVSGHNGPDC